MAMDKPLLNDPNQYPDDAALRKCLGQTKAVWDEFVGGAAAAVDGAELNWHYYNDGKAWLCKLARKKKTICWISAWDGFFKTTFYFSEKSDEDIENLSIGLALKHAYSSATRLGKLKPLTVEVKAKKLLPDLYALMKYKSKQ